MASDVSVALREELRRMKGESERLVELLYNPVAPAHAGVRIDEIEVNGRSAEWMVPEAALEGTVFMYLHGGGYVAPYNGGYRRMLSHLSALAQVAVFAPRYRLAGESPFPAAIEDAVAAYHWLIDQGTDPSRVVIGGDSAGAGLTVATLVSLVHEGVAPPAGQVLISPWVDLEGTGDSMSTAAELDPFMTFQGNLGCAMAYAAGDSLRNPLISPIYADLRGLPPMLILVGGHEILRDDAIRLAAAAGAADVEVQLQIVQGMWHIFPIHIGERDSHEVISAAKSIAGFVRSRIAPELAAPQAQETTSKYGR
jgi:epsilon-lactone hydrolase